MLVTLSRDEARAIIFAPDNHQLVGFHVVAIVHDVWMGCTPAVEPGDLSPARKLAKQLGYPEQFAIRVGQGRFPTVPTDAVFFLIQED